MKGHLEYTAMTYFVLGSGLLQRGDSVLLVRCHYDAEPENLWTLPGGRQEAGEFLVDTVRREFLEEASLTVAVRELAYVSESVDLEIDLHVLNCTFLIDEVNPAAQARPADSKVLEARFVPVADAPALLRADVLRIPVAAALSGAPYPHYFSFRAKDIVVPFFSNRRKRS
ncbi:MAG: NUDIX hydrolase [Candidatus Eremiobacteraeota bacterium]|nr:NUDIX hydrolase [Candidatus Eremiobacteraeota bacterium]